MPSTLFEKISLEYTRLPDLQASGDSLVWLFLIVLQEHSDLNVYHRTGLLHLIPGMMMHTFNPGSREAEQVNVCEAKAT